MPGLAGITFDVWNTLVAEHPAAREVRLTAIGTALATHGESRSDAEIGAALDALRRWFDERWIANQVVDPRLGAEHVATSLQLPDHEGIHGEIEAVFRRGSDPEFLTIAPGIGDALTAIREAGLRVGIISDTGFAPGATLRRYLAHHGLLDHFDHWSFSDEVGVFKPDPAIFDHAAAGLGVSDPACLAHVGDLRRTDVGGAVGAGWTGIRYRGLHDDPTDAPDAVHIIDHHAELETVLGLR